MKRFGIATLAITVIGIGSAAAQNVVTDPGTIAHCLCARHDTAVLKDRVREAQLEFDQDKAAVDTLDQQIAQTRVSVDVSIRGQVDALKALNVQREQLYAQVYNVDLPALQAAIRNYDNAAGPYATYCAGRNFDAAVMAQVQRHLSCPVPPQSE